MRNRDTSRPDWYAGYVVPERGSGEWPQGNEYDAMIHVASNVGQQ